MRAWEWTGLYFPERRKKIYTKLIMLIDATPTFEQSSKVVANIGLQLSKLLFFI